MTISQNAPTLLAAAGIVIAPLVASASQADLAQPTYHACASAPQLAQIAQSVVEQAGGRQTLSLRSLSGLRVSIKGSGGRYDVQAGSAAPATVNAPVDALACQAVAPQAVRLLNGGDIAGDDLAAISAVMSYRQSHPWPSAAAHPDDPRTQIDVQNRNGRAIISIVDFKTLYSKNALNCGGEEYYRVDLQTFEVQPFAGCSEGAAPSRTLPTLKELPG